MGSARPRANRLGDDGSPLFFSGSSALPIREELGPWKNHHGHRYGSRFPCGSGQPAEHPRGANTQSTEGMGLREDSLGASPGPLSQQLLVCCHLSNLDCVPSLVVTCVLKSLVKPDLGSEPRPTGICSNLTQGRLSASAGIPRRIHCCAC